jgi:hypothetical protein
VRQSDRAAILRLLRNPIAPSRLVVCAFVMITTNETQPNRQPLQQNASFIAGLRDSLYAPRRPALSKRALLLQTRAWEWCVVRRFLDQIWCFSESNSLHFFLAIVDWLV